MNQQTTSAALWMSGAIMAFTLTAVAGREASASISVTELILYRNLFGLVLIFVLLRWFRPEALATAHYRAHWLRNSSHFIGQWCWFYGLSLLPLATVFALEFTVPVWATLFAIWFLQERLNRARLVAVVAGFAGVLLILRPGLEIIQSASWVVLAGAIAYAFAHTMTKKIAGRDSVATLLFFMHLMQLPLALLAFLLLVDQAAAVNTGILAWVALTSIAAIAAHYCMAKALSLADALVVMPMDYLRLPVAVMIGWLLYQEGLDFWLLLGGLVMLVGNLAAVKSKSRVSS